MLAGTKRSSSHWVCCSWGAWNLYSSSRSRGREVHRGRKSASGIAFSGLTISKVDVERDVALLDTPDLNGKNLPGLEFVTFSETNDPGRLSVLGYPYAIDLIFLRIFRCLI